MAAPMVAVTVSQYLLQVVSMMMVGHIGKLSFSAVAIATSFAEVTGFSVLLGMAGALETLCGQTYGAEEFRKLGNYTCCAIITLMLVCVPISMVWIFMDRILLLFGQDPQISDAARIYCIFLIPALFGYAVLQSLVRYLQTQSMMFPMVLSSIAVLCLHMPVCWILVFRLGLGHVGAALAIGISYWFNVIGLGLYVKYSSACEKTQIVFSTNALLSIKEFFQLAIPSGLMFCLNTTTLHYFIPYGIGAAASTRVSNELGAGNPKTARKAGSVAMVVGIAEAVVMNTALFFSGHVLGYAYSNEKEVVDYVAQMVPFLCLSVIADSLVGVLSGIARGGGFQQVGAYVNLGAYYLVGVPIALVLGFSVHLRAKGLWIGILTGSIVQAIVLAVVTAFTDWQKEATKARERVTKKSIKGCNGV
ncbi:protein DETOXIFICATION 9-like [Senna tora]|uniref:Protein DETOXIFICATION 9-like n=1 Tax=Senna tora TaxID=362788 RepID=A0A834WGG7_9FABA|nr:protein DETOXIFICATION 9-like [Senna tora]